MDVHAETITQRSITDVAESILDRPTPTVDSKIEKGIIDRTALDVATIAQAGDESIYLAQKTELLVGLVYDQVDTAEIVLPNVHDLPRDQTIAILAAAVTEKVIERNRPRFNRVSAGIEQENGIVHPVYTEVDEVSIPQLERERAELRHQVALLTANIAAERVKVGDRDRMIARIPVESLKELYKRAHISIRVGTRALVSSVTGN